MSKVHDDINESLAEFIRGQHIFFVGTAPRADDGLVNVSPKGLDTLRILGPRRVAYLDLTGSGIETVAHLRENGRIVFMFCAFEGAPKIVRLHGRGVVYQPGEPGYTELAPLFGTFPGARAIVDVTVVRVADACGFSVPYYEYRGDRDQLDKFAERMGPALASYRRQKNTLSIDGLPGLLPGDAVADDAGGKR